MERKRGGPNGEKNSTPPMTKNLPPSNRTNNPVDSFRNFVLQGENEVEIDVVREDKEDVDGMEVQSRSLLHSDALFWSGQPDRGVDVTATASAPLKATGGRLRLECLREQIASADALVQLRASFFVLTPTGVASSVDSYASLSSARDFQAALHSAVV